MRVLATSLLIGCSLAYGHSALSQDLPSGYRLPTPSELSDPDRNESDTRFAKAEADFNGDGVLDTALLLKSTAYSGQALFVYLSEGTKRRTWVMLDSIDWGAKYKDVNLSMAIEVLPPGTHQYYCFDDECNGGERKNIPVPTASISYFRFESSGSFYFWDARKKAFRRAWNSL